jgi:hypothetical protein
MHIILMIYFVLKSIQHMSRRRKVKKNNTIKTLYLLIIIITLTFSTILPASAIDYNFVQITNNNYNDTGVQINSSGNMVWYGDDNSGNPNDKLFYYNGTTITKLTGNHSYKFSNNNDVIFQNGPSFPLYIYSNGVTNKISDVGGYSSMNNVGDVVWQAASGNETQVFRYNKGITTQISHVSYGNPALGASEPKINDSGQIVWYQGSSSAPRDIYRYDPNGNIQQITNGVRNESPNINNLGQIFYRGSGASGYNLSLYNNGQNKVIANNWDALYGLTLNNNNQIAWMYNSEVFLYNITTESTQKLTNNGMQKTGLTMNDKGELVWSEYDGHDYEMMYYKNGFLKQITNNTVDDISQQINNNGQIAFIKSDGNDFEVYRANPVPIPGSVWLFGSGLIGMGLVGLRRRIR